MVRLNLGCGNNVLIDWENYDLFPLNDKVKKINLNVLPLPFDDCSARYILLSHVFEHLDVNRLDFLHDIYRILAPGGVVEIRVLSAKETIEHTKGFFISSYFDSICATNMDTPTYVGCVFSKLSFERIGRDNFSRLLDVFPFLEKMFPLLQSCEFVW